MFHIFGVAGKQMLISLIWFESWVSKPNRWTDENQKTKSHTEKKRFIRKTMLRNKTSTSLEEKRTKTNNITVCWENWNDDEKDGWNWNDNGWMVSWFYMKKHKKKRRDEFMKSLSVYNSAQLAKDKKDYLHGTKNQKFWNWNQNKFRQQWNA